jgi:hypothetical protein
MKFKTNKRKRNRKTNSQSFPDKTGIILTALRFKTPPW